MTSVSKCAPGEERHEVYYSAVLRKNLVQYEYRTPEGKLWSTVATTLEECRARRDVWLKIEAQKVEAPAHHS